MAGKEMEMKMDMHSTNEATDRRKTAKIGSTVAATRAGVNQGSRTTKLVRASFQAEGSSWDDQRRK